MSSQTGNGDPNDCPCSAVYNEDVRVQIESVLANPVPVDWHVVHRLLRCLGTDVAQTAQSRFTSAQHDPVGRLLLAAILSRNPPFAVLQTMLEVFPDSLSHNPAAFFVACEHASPSLIAHMTRHSTRSFDDSQDECPYPWILSEHISVEGAKAMLEAFPRGVMQQSSFLCSYNLLDYFLMSPEMVQQRRFDPALWNKFKLILVAAQCGSRKACSAGRCEIAPVQVILSRVLSCSDFWDSPKRAEHVLWLLHQLRWTDRWVFEKQSPDGGYPVHLVLSRKCTPGARGLVAARALVQLLLEAHPQSAAHWVSGKLALHMAVENGWPCHDLLLVLHPEALDAPDPRSELFPFQSAAKHHQVTECSFSLDVTYELLRANPTHARSIGKEARSVGTPA